MKKAVLFIFLAFLCSPVFAEEEEVYLELGSTEPRFFETGKLNFGNPQTDYEEDEKYLKPSDTFYSIKQMFKEDIYPNKSEQQ